MPESFTPSAAPAAGRMPTVAAPPALAQRRGLWALPLVLSLLFMAGVVLWAYRADRDEREEQRRTLISDALSTEAQLRARLDLEGAHLRALAGALSAAPRSRHTLATQPEAEAGLRRLWLSVTWLDANNRILAHVPDEVATPMSPAGRGEEGAGLSAHLVAPVRAGGLPDGPDANRFDVLGEKLVVRFSPALLLKRDTPWWLARRYEVRLVDGSDQVIAAVDDSPLRLGATPRESYRVQVGGGLPGVFLELTLRETPPAWWRSLPLVPLAGFLALIVGATALLRRQVRQVSHAEAAWRTEAAWRSAMEDSALVALRARDAEGRLLYVNRTFCQMVGLPAEQLIGRLPPMPYWPPDSMEAAMMRSRRNLAGLAPREGYEAHWCHQDGHVLDVMVFESPLVNALNQQIGWMGSIIDITERKRLEERERRQTEALAHQARLTTLGEVASALAHQLNQPLTAITGYNGGVLRMLERAGGADPLVLQALRRQGEQAAEAGRIVRRIREFLTRRSPQREAVNMAALAERALGLLRRDLQRQHVQIEWAIPSDLPAVLADPVLVEQVLINLVRNAADELVAHRPPDARRVRLSARAVLPGWLRLAVDDSGPGLNGLRIEQLSAPFYSTKPEGMGMGLAICRSVIEAHHGGMDAQPCPELGGACFSFSLPLLESPVEPPVDLPVDLPADLSVEPPIEPPAAPLPETPNTHAGA